MGIDYLAGTVGGTSIAEGPVHTDAEATTVSPDAAGAVKAYAVLAGRTLAVNGHTLLLPMVKHPVKKFLFI